jgi:hypothetical protein
MAQEWGEAAVFGGSIVVLALANRQEIILNDRWRSFEN